MGRGQDGERRALSSLAHSFLAAPYLLEKMRSAHVLEHTRVVHTRANKGVPSIKKHF